MKIPPETECMKLLDMTEQEANEWLQDYDHLISDCPEKLSFVNGNVIKVHVWESLPDLSNRLWKLAVKHLTLPKAIQDVTEYSTGVRPMKRESIEAWWIYTSQPIHRIIAALIALGRAGVEL